MLSALIRLLSFAGSIASLLALALWVSVQADHLAKPQIAILALGGFFLIITIVFTVRDRKPGRIAFKKDSEIKEYMRKWISKGSRVAIFSRDMSWVDEGIRGLLSEKAARQGQLVNCSHHVNG